MSTKNGKKRLNGKPKIDGGVVDVNKNNVNSGKTGQMSYLFEAI